MIPAPNFSYEQPYWDYGYEYVIGMDEVGRGAFAGPVVTAGVIFPKTFMDTKGIHDSKLLSHVKRTELTTHIRSHAIHVIISEVSVEEINSIGIGKATTRAFDQVLSEIFSIINQKNCFVLVDGRPLPTLCCGEKQEAIVKGDQKSLSIAAASIIAKVYRDALMINLDSAYPEYAFAQHKGYGTIQHRQAIKEHGLTNIHRTSFDLSAYL